MTIEDRQTAAPDAGGDDSAAPQTEGATTTDNDGGSEPQRPAVSYETESEARSMGWVPQNEWRGDPKHWRPADEFVTRGKEVLPIVRSQLDRERRKVQELESKLNEIPGSIEAKYADRFKRLEKMNAVALQKQADQIYRQFEERKRAAVEAADPAAYDRASEAQRQALADLSADFEAPAAPEAKPAPQPMQKIPAEVSEWIDRNSWFNKDAVLTAVASAEHARLLSSAPGMTLEQNFRKVDEFLRQKFPEKFGIDPQQTARAHSPQVEGGNRQPGGTSKGRGWNDLPPEAKQAGERNISRDGLFLPDGVTADKATPEDIKKARNAYADAYWSQE